MRRTSRPAVEWLEGKTLLSHAVPTSGLTATLTAITTRTATGIQIVATLTETNRTNHVLNVTDGPSIDGFVATQNGKTAWVSNPGPQPLFVTLKTLEPHQSFTISSTWDGRSNQGEGPLSGTFTITNELAPDASRTVRLIQPGTPEPNLPHITPPKPVIHHHA